jgi:REP element-mobilizing transposase RayT
LEIPGFVWATWDRAPLITPAVEPRLHASISAKCRELKCDVVEIGGTEDHVHALVRLHATIGVAALAHGMKGSSSHLANHILAPDSGFKWQGSYGAFSVSPNDIDRTRDYIKRQKEHHAHSSTIPEWERCMETD